jgi:hypothetical protein
MILEKKTLSGKKNPSVDEDLFSMHGGASNTKEKTCIQLELNLNCIEINSIQFIFN